ncbi:hypothetical protein [Halanaerobium praevalens]|uniref:Uncharacterized protein n=1 Tax=Halanaerobium praevalens (strain ATCC 33744 / DSM 2228 / GSL) TaxID=572479 RepID=E3DMK1_HALPG|nr:hypothetical protein [Halanaerobium praevalens]ADO77409.1 hypothetical protein Hprae_1272 [Halanaerobium praevalens DSM 2228]
MANKCGSCGCGSHSNCKTKQLDQTELEEIIKKRNKNRRKYNIKYKVKLAEMQCTAEELIDRVKAYTGIVDEVEFTADEVIIAYDDRLITPAEISDLVE